MYVLLESNNDPMGGGASFTFRSVDRNLEQLKEYRRVHSGPWQSFAIARILSEDELGVVTCR